MIIKPQNTPANKRWGFFCLVGYAQPRGGNMALAQSLQTVKKACPIKPIYDSLTDEDKAVFDKEVEKKLL